MSAMAHQLTHVFLLVYAGLFPIVNPVGNAPIFLALTRYCTDRERRALALRVAINGFFLLLGSLFLGSYVLEFFGITLPVLRIAGGVVVAAFGWTLLQGGPDNVVRGADEQARAGLDRFGDAARRLRWFGSRRRECRTKPRRRVLRRAEYRHWTHQPVGVDSFALQHPAGSEGHH